MEPVAERRRRPGCRQLRAVPKGGGSVETDGAGRTRFAHAAFAPDRVDPRPVGERRLRGADALERQVPPRERRPGPAAPAHPDLGVAGLRGAAEGRGSDLDEFPRQPDDPERDESDAGDRRDVAAGVPVEAVSEDLRDDPGRGRERRDRGEQAVTAFAGREVRFDCAAALRGAGSPQLSESYRRSFRGERNQGTGGRVFSTFPTVS